MHYLIKETRWVKGNQNNSALIHVYFEQLYQSMLTKLTDQL